MAENISTRVAYGRALAEFGDDQNIVVIDADLATSTMSYMFRDKYPERFFNAGVAEANMVCMGAGFATTGKTVFVNSFAVFSTGRAFDQIRTSVVYPHLNVKVVGTHAGVSVGEDGPTHQCLEDIGTMRTLPGMVVVCPCDGTETREAVRAIIDYNGPVYLRLGRAAVEDLTSTLPGYKFTLGKGTLLKNGSDVTIIATGLMVQEAMKAADKLSGKVNVRVIDMHTIKPIDKEMIISAAKETGAIITAEEHNIIGGLGSAVAEVLVENCPVPMMRVGMNDEFGKSGKAAALMVKYGFTADNLCEKVEEILKRK